MSKIVLNVYRPEKGVCGVVRLNEQAEHIVSQIIIQGYDLVEIKEEK